MRYVCMRIKWLINNGKLFLLKDIKYKVWWFFILKITYYILHSGPTHQVFVWILTKSDYDDHTNEAAQKLMIWTRCNFMTSMRSNPISSQFEFTHINFHRRIFGKYVAALARSIILTAIMSVQAGVLYLRWLLNLTFLSSKTKCLLAFYWKSNRSITGKITCMLNLFLKYSTCLAR